MTDPLVIRPAPEEVDAASSVEHPGPAPVYAPTPKATFGRDDYDAGVRLEPGEIGLVIKGHDPSFEAAARAYAADSYKRGGPRENVEAVLQMAEQAALQEKRLPNSSHLSEADKGRLRYRLSQRVRFVGPDSILLGLAPDPAFPVTALVAALTTARAFVERDLKATLDAVCNLDPITHEPIRASMDADEAAYVATYDLALQEIDDALALAGGVD